MIEVKHWKNGNIKRILVKNDKGLWHNPHGPAIQEWYENGQEKSRRYWVDGKLHNSSAPACYEWYENGQEGYKAYYVDGKYHNPHEPAIQEWYKNGTAGCRAYFINGKEITEKDFLARQNTVEVTVEGKTTRISRESAKTLNLIKE